VVACSAGVRRTCCFLTIGLAITWFTVASAVADEIGSCPTNGPTHNATHMINHRRRPIRCRHPVGRVAPRSGLGWRALPLRRWSSPLGVGGVDLDETCRRQRGRPRLDQVRSRRRSGSSGARRSPVLLPGQGRDGPRPPQGLRRRRQPRSARSLLRAPPRRTRPAHATTRPPVAGRRPMPHHQLCERHRRANLPGRSVARCRARDAYGNPTDWTQFGNTVTAYIQAISGSDHADQTAPAHAVPSPATRPQPSPIRPCATSNQPLRPSDETQRFALPVYLVPHGPGARCASAIPMNMMACGEASRHGRAHPSVRDWERSQLLARIQETVRFASSNCSDTAALSVPATTSR